MQNPDRNVMRTVKLDKTELLDIVRKNAVKHNDEYNESVEDYKKLVLKLATDNLKLAKSQTLESFSKIKSLPPGPASYADSYNRAIRMLELSVDSVIELEEQIFNQLVLDEWSWKRVFTANATMYKSSM